MVVWSGSAYRDRQSALGAADASGYDLIILPHEGPLAGLRVSALADLSAISTFW